MHRQPRPFSSLTFQPAHRLLSPGLPDSNSTSSRGSNSNIPYSSRSRVTPEVTVDDIDNDDEYNSRVERDRQRLRAEAVKEMARQSWEDEGAAATSVPLLPLGRSQGSTDGNGAGGHWKSGQRQQHTLLSRTPSPYPGLVGGNGNPGVGGDEYRKRGGPGDGKFSSWFKRGKLGWWFWNTGRGWISLVTALVVWTVGSGILLVFQNQIILRFGVYKYIPFLWVSFDNC